MPMYRSLLFFTFFFVILSAKSVFGAPEIKKIISPLGIEIWYVQEKSLPILAVDIVFKNAGFVTEPLEIQGIGRLVSITLNEGAGDLESLDFLRRIEELSIDLRFNIGTDTFGIDLRTLTKNKDEAFSLLGLALNKPRFDEGPVERMRDLLINDITRRLNIPDDIVGKAWLAAAYPNHPYGRNSRGSIETVGNITIQDLKDFVSTRFTRDRVVVGAVGDVEPEEIARLIDISLGSLPVNGPKFEINNQPPATDGEMVVINQDIPQSTALIGAKGILRDDPDYYAASLLNSALGGASFMSRLWKAVRQERGLAYSVNSFLVPMKHSSYFMVSVATKNEKIGETLDVIENEILSIIRYGLTEEELRNIKTYAIGKFALNLDRNSRIASILAGMQIANLDSDYIVQRIALINAVTNEDIKRVARRIFLSEPNLDLTDESSISLNVVIIGNPDGLQESSN